MKKLFIIMLLACSGTGFAQQDYTTKATDSIPKSDTIRVGNIIIIKNPNSGWSNPNVKVSTSSTPKKPKNVKTNWWIVDIGYSGVNDLTDYGSQEAISFMRNPGNLLIEKGDFALRSTRVSNFSLWFFIQKRNLIKHVLNLKYGFGMESNNYFYKTSLTYVDGPNPYVMRDNVSFSKNKLVANYLTVPIMFNINTSPNSRKRGFELSAGISGGLLYKSHQKQKSAERGKQKQHTDFNLERFKLAFVGELGIGPVQLYGSYALTPLHKYGVEQMPYNVGIRLGKL